MKKQRPETDILGDAPQPGEQTRELQIAATTRGWRRYWLFLTHVVSESFKDDLPLMGAALAHFALMSIIPLLMLITAAFGIYLKSDRAREQAIRIVSQYAVPGGHIDSMQELDQADPTVTFVFRQLVNQRGTVGGFGLVALLWICLRIFMTLQRALDRIWKIEQHEKRPLYMIYPVALVTIVGVGLIAWLSVALTSIVSSLRFEWPQKLIGFEFQMPDWGQLLSIVVSILMSILLMFLIYRFLPSAKVRSRSAVYGAVTSGILWETVKHLFASWLNYGAVYARIYGAMAGMVVFVFWTYLSALILLFGAEVVYCHATYISVKPVIEDEHEGGPEQPDTIPERQGTKDAAAAQPDAAGDA